MMVEADSVRNHKSEERYEMVIKAKLAIATYERREGALVFRHAQVLGWLEGRGIGSGLVRATFSDAREQGLKVVPVCEFVAANIECPLEEPDLLALNAPE